MNIYVNLFLHIKFRPIVRNQNEWVIVLIAQYKLFQELWSSPWLKLIKGVLDWFWAHAVKITKCQKWSFLWDVCYAYCIAWLLRWTFYRNENKYYITIFYKKCLHPEYKKNAINHYLPLRIDTIILLSAGHEVMTPVHKRKSDDIIYRLKWCIVLVVISYKECIIMHFKIL